MADPKHLAILKQGVDVWNEWSSKHYLNKVKPDLSGANLAGMDLSRIILSDVDLSDADLSEATLVNATLVRTNFTRATLIKAELDGADFHQAILWQANLRSAFLSGALFNYTDLEEANLSHATVDLTIFGDVDLRNVRGLKSIRHQGPSLISTTALVRSQGNIPEVFLRKAGVPDSFIEYSHSLLTNPIEYYSCFISYSNKDQDFADRLYADLLNKGVSCWFAPHDMRIGDKIRPRIDESIRLHDKLLLVLTEHSVASQWVEHEVETALGKELEGKPNVLFPIRLDDRVMESRTGWASHIRLTRHIGDFTSWKNHDNYQRAFNRLLRDLKAGA
jgi:uncharacterized protein YjbI with pentapeptide repeats